MDDICRNLSLEELLRNYSGNNGAWYWIGMAYMERGDYSNAAEWLEKTKNDSGDHGWQATAAFNLGIIYRNYLKRKQDALRIFETLPGSALANLNAGAMYSKGEGVDRNPDKGVQLVDKAITGIINTRGNDDYFAANECFEIAEVYRDNGLASKAVEYFKKTVARCNTSHASDRNLKEWAENNIQNGGSTACPACGGRTSAHERGGRWCENSQCHKYHKVYF
jgi:TPR repeat protein